LTRLRGFPRIEASEGEEGDMAWRRRRGSLIAFVALGLIAVPVGPTRAADPITFSVNTYTDEVDLDTGGIFDGVCDSDAALGEQCTLRAAVQEANANPGADTINISGGTPTTSIPTTFENAALDGDLDITDDVTIQGAGPGPATVDGGDVEGVFQVVPGDIDATFSNLVITSGFNTGFGAGGGLRDSSTGTLTLDGVTITDNEAMGGSGFVDLAGTLFMTETTVSGNRTTGGGTTGAISLGNFVTANVTHSTISGNQAMTSGVNGGAFSVVNASLILTNSTLSGNSATASGGGIFYNFTTTITLNSATVTGNTADSDNAGGGDGGGIAVGGTPTGTPTLRNSILAGNLDASAGAPDCAGPITSQGYNLIGTTTGCTVTPTNDLVEADPVLGPLQDNGGQTQTHALQTGSAAIDAAAPTGCTDGSTQLSTDQRGLIRHADGDANGAIRCDIGAFELQGPIVNVSVTGSGTVTGPGIACPGDCSQSVVEGASISLAETPGAGTTFSGWGSDCAFAGMATTCDLDVGTQDLFVTATFAGPSSQPKTSKTVGLTAKPRRVDPGGRTRLKAVIGPCDLSTRNDTVEFRKGAAVIGQKVVNEDCTAVLKRRVRRKAAFKAFSPEDEDSLAAISSKVTVRVSGG
jgi:CSLREA domain-containing protein